MTVSRPLPAPAEVHPALLQSVALTLRPTSGEPVAVETRVLDLEPYGDGGTALVVACPEGMDPDEHHFDASVTWTYPLGRMECAVSTRPAIRRLRQGVAAAALVRADPAAAAGVLPCPGSGSDLADLAGDAGRRRHPAGEPARRRGRPQRGRRAAGHPGPGAAGRPGGRGDDPHRQREPRPTGPRRAPRPVRGRRRRHRDRVPRPERAR
ncbi:hypothetical protein [Nocardioides convexus]|uniref:hypothetical protein n=1 Tax=Nocardioides convexus TaxID=2712224 RepID=UPI0024187447|nr:hypothetical protein [Nocardioides convexus]